MALDIDQEPPTQPRRQAGDMSVSHVGRSSVMTRHTTFRFCLDPDGRAAGGAVTARRGGAVRVQPVPTDGENRAHTTPERPGCRGAVDRVRPDQRLQRVEEDRGCRPGVRRRSDGRRRDPWSPGWRGGARCVSRCSRKPPSTCGRALKAWSDSRSRQAQWQAGRISPIQEEERRRSRRFGCATNTAREVAGDPGRRQRRPRSVTLPGIGQIRVHDDTRRLRRMLAKGRAKILFATVSHHAGRWWIALNVEAADLHPAHQHPARDRGDAGGWVGVDRGLSAFLVAATADGTEVARITMHPRRWPPG